MSYRNKIGDILLSSIDKVALAPADAFVRIFPETGGVIFSVALMAFSIIATAPIVIVMERVGVALKRNG